MDQFMSSQVTKLSKRVITLFADFWIVPTWDQFVDFQNASLNEELTSEFKWICSMCLKSHQPELGSSHSYCNGNSALPLL